MFSLMAGTRSGSPGNPARRISGHLSAFSGTIWTLIAILRLACLGVAAFIAGMVVLVIFLVRAYARSRENGSPGA